MRRLARRLRDSLRRRKEARAAWALDGIKACYHTFRVILSNNERALDLFSDLDAAMRSPAGQAPGGLAAVLEDLLAVTYEMVDGLNRLTDYAYNGLYGLHREVGERARLAAEEIAPGPAEVPLCMDLREVGPEAVPQAGGKASSLAALLRQGLPVPPGFVVTAEAGRSFLAHSGLDYEIRGLLRRLGTIDPEGAAGEIREAILAAPLPQGLAKAVAEAYAELAAEAGPAVSVRSSAAAEDGVERSYAGQFTSVLNVTDTDGVLEAWREVMAGNFSARSLAYRTHNGLPLAEFSMAALCQSMVPARAAGVLFTVDPADAASERMLLTAVPGLGTTAVGGDAPADVYRPLRADPEAPAEVGLAVKDEREVCAEGGGVRREAVPEEERQAPVLDLGRVAELARVGLLVESLAGRPQDIEWAVDRDGGLRILQARPARVSGGARERLAARPGSVLLQGGVASSGGRCIGRVRIMHSLQDLERTPEEPVVAVLRQSSVEAARWIPRFQGVVVDLGNPADHLSCVAREFSRPMLTAVGTATRDLEDGQWVVLDADRGQVLEAPPAAWREALRIWKAGPRRVDAPADPAPAGPGLARLRELTLALNLTDAYGPTFSITECRSLHDVVRFTHEMAVMSMFEAGDELVEEAGALVHWLDEGVPFHFLIIDVGGGLGPGVTSRRIHLADVASEPLRALWQGIATPGLRWNKAPVGGDLSGLMVKSMLDKRGRRPVGNFNYALAARDYLNLNARVDYHFCMIDAVCGPSARENHVRFRFKGGGAAQELRERRARFIARVLEAHGFFTDQRGDMVTGTLLETGRDEVAGQLSMLGRLLGFSRLLDAAMKDEDAVEGVFRAFQSGDYSLEGLSAQA